MNRHAKSHGNDKLKAQRTFFAQASRNRSKQRLSPNPHTETGVPLQSKDSILPEARAQKHNKTLHHHSLHSSQSSGHLQQPADGHSRTSRRRPDRSQSLTHNRPSIAKISNHSLVGIEASGTRPQSHNATKPVTTYEVPNSIDEMKRKLLDQSDWLGLSACRPAKIEFAPASDMAKIGRHRRSTHLKDQDTKNQQYSTKPLTGKRKRSEQEKNSTHLNTDGCASGGASQEQVDNRPPRRLLKDPDRRFYVLTDDNAYSVVAPNDLLSLEEARDLDNFDAVRERHIELRKKGHTANVHGGNIIKGVCRESTVRTAESKSIPDPGTSGSDVVMQEPLSNATLNSPISLTRHGTSLRHMGNNNTNSPHLTRVQDTKTDQPINPVVAAGGLHAKQQKDVLTSALRESGITIKNFALKTEVPKGKHKLQSADSSSSDHAIDHIWPNSVMRPRKEISPSPNKEVRPRVRFQLDEIFGQEDGQVLNHDHDTFLEKHRNDIDRHSVPDTVLSPHFLHQVDSRETSRSSNIVPSSRIWTTSRNQGAEGLRYGSTEHVWQDQRHKVRERPLTDIFLDSPSSSLHSTMPLPPQIRTVPTAPKRVQMSSRICDQTSSLDSSSS